MASPDSAPVTSFRWVKPLAIVNVIWLVVGIALIASGTMLAVFGYFLLPQLFLAAVHPIPILIGAIIVTAAVVIAAIATGRATRTVGYRVWAFGTLALSISLVAGLVAVMIVWSNAAP